MNRFFAPALLILSAIATSACSPTRISSVETGTQGQIEYQAPSANGTGFGGSSSGSSSSGSSSGTTTGTGGGLPPLTLRVGTVGYNATSVEVDVRAVLKVRFTPAIQDEVVAGTGFSPAYGRLGVYIQVGTMTQATEMLSNGLLDGMPQKSRVIDFSNGFVHSCDPTDLTCHQPVTIKVFKPNNDYFCLNFGQYCPWANLYETHPWHGTLSIQTDDTDPI